VLSSRLVELAGCLLALMVSACAEPASRASSSGTPVNAGDAPGIADQIRPNWNVGSQSNDPDLDQKVVTLHVSLLPDGTITNVTAENDYPNDPKFQQAVQRAKRAMLMTKKLKLPPGKTYQAITFKLLPNDIQ
jgi:membrane protein involved in colicin uptake